MSRQKPEDVIGRPAVHRRGIHREPARRPRGLYLRRARQDVTAHPAFRNAARSIARLYDALHDPKQKDVLTCPTDTGSGGFTHKFFRVAQIARGTDRPARGDRALGAHDLRLDGATPDYKASLMNTLGANIGSTSSSPTTPSAGTRARRTTCCS